MKIQFIEKKGSPLYIRTIIRAGARYDEKEGQAHFLEHMLCAGTKKFPTKNLLAEYIENIGGSFSLNTDSDYIRINIQVAEAQDLPIAMTLLNEMLNESLFDAVTFEKERGSILSELANKKANQKEYVWEVYKKVFFQDTPLEKSVIGTEETIKSITLEDIISFKERNFNENNVSFVVAGDIEFATLEAELNKIANGFKGKENQISEELPIIRKIPILSQEYNSNLVSIMLGFRTETYSLLNDVCSLLCANYFAIGRTSLLIQELRYRRGLVYSISSITSLHIDRGTFGVKTDCDQKDYSQVVSIIKEQLTNFSRDLISEEKLNFLKSKVIKSYKIKLQTSEAVVAQNEKSALISEAVGVEEYIKQIERVTLDDIRNYAQRNFINENFFIAICGPEKSVIA